MGRKRKYPEVSGYWVYSIYVPSIAKYYIGTSKKQCSQRWSKTYYKNSSLSDYLNEWDSMIKTVLIDGLTRDEALKKEDELIQELRKKRLCINSKRSGLITSDLNAYSKELRKNNPYLREREKQYYEDNKEQIQQYYENNKEQILEQRKQYYKDNKEQISEYKKQWYEKNKEQIKQRAKQRYENDTEYREQQKEYYKQRYQNDAEYRERTKQRCNQYYERKKLEKQQTQLNLF